MNIQKKTLLAVYLSTVFFLQGCMTKKPSHPQDPFEPLNRQIFLFNYNLDKVVYRPVAKFYVKVTPTPMQKAISNFFNNLDEIPSFVSDVFQLDLHNAVLNGTRFAINSTLGLLGTIDVASKMGFRTYKNDFGLTLHRWGIKDTPYIQLAFLGPSTLHDTAGLAADFYVTPLPYYINAMSRYGMTTFRTVSFRASLLPTDQLIDESIDPYIFVRDAYLQKRKADVERIREKPKSLKVEKEDFDEYTE